MPGSAFLLLNGITGESKTMPNNIEVESYSFGASNPANIGSNGLSGGTVSLSDFSFTCEVDASSAAILSQLYSGKPIDSAVFSLVESTGAAQAPPYLTVTFTNCYVTSQSLGGGNQGKPSQSVSFAYEKIAYAFSTQNSADGSVSNAGNATFDISTATTS
ncbi:MAG TPA: type VI secretion system tube protein Hcp [Candidatus Binatus sp.]|jgi:type VI secretion system secreted protein Hcp|nr:type VI secretion system tube protein Hcp [Candidatus Binatus sp.]